MCNQGGHTYRYHLTPNLMNKKRNGFALVIALSLMAFVLILVLSLTTLTQVEIQTSDKQVRLLNAQSNALLGMKVAIGQLQESLGQDQRVSARAEILDIQRGSSGRMLHPHWTGVWKQPENISAGFPEGIDPRAKAELQTWLVSGNEGQLNYEPSVALTDNSVKLASGFAAIEELNSPELVPLQAPYVLVEAGGYAYAVIDEGVKAKLNSVSTNFEPGSPPLLPLSNGSIAYDDFGLEPQADSKDWIRYNEMDTVFNLNEANLTAKSAHLSQSATLFHKGVLSDTLRGGLQLDLSSALRMNRATFKTDVIDKYLPHDEIYRPYHPTVRGGGPSWDVFRQYAQLGARNQADEYLITPTDLSQEQIGVYPILERFQLHTVIRVAATQDPVQTDNYSFRPRIYHLPSIVLWNPYNKTIVANEGLVVRWRRQNRTEGDWRYLYAAGYYQDGDWNGLPIAGGAVGEFPVFYEKWQGGDRERYIDFELTNESGGNEITIPPGESRIFTMQSNQEYSPSASQAVTMRQGWGTFGFYQDAEDEVIMDVASLGVDPPSVFIDLRTPQDVDNNSELDIWSNFILRDRGSTQYAEYRNLRWKFYDDNGDEQPSGLLTGKDTVSEQSSHFFGDDQNGPSPVEVFSFDSSSSLNFRGLPSTNQPAHEDGLDVSLIGYELGLKTINPEVSETYPQLRDTASLLHRHNIRANSSNTVPGEKDASLGAYNFVNRQYYFLTVVENSEISVPGSQFGYQVANENFKIETWSTDQASFLGFSDTPEGSDRLVLFRLPNADEEILSVGDFRHLDLRSAEPDELKLNGNGEWDSNNFGPSFVVGEAHANYHLQSNSYTDNDFVPDYQWITNRQLWDRFFVSTVPSQQQPTFPLDNGKMVLAGSDLDAETLQDLTSFDKAASALLLDGAFNINSTSVRAWEAIFSQYFGRQAGDVSVTDGALFLDIPEPQSAFNPTTAGSTANWSSQTDAWKGIRILSQTEIRSLAEAMVQEVKRRGPFLSLSEFVNRSIRSDAELAVFTDRGSELNSSLPDLSELAEDPRIFGALQAAIEKANLNSGFEDYVIEAIDELPLSDERLYGFRAAGLGSYAEGIAGYLTQGKLLNRIGPSLRPRSDTFIIRAYGNARDALDDRIQAEVYCEAVLQRLPDYVDSIDTPDARVSELASFVNEQFGRRFEIVSFRWLTSDEI